MAAWTYLFMTVWIYLRHYINLCVIWSIVSPHGEWVTTAPHTIDWEKEHYKGMLARVIAGSLLAGLQALNLFWLYHILRIVYRFVMYNDAEDDRSAGGDAEETTQLLAEMKAADADADAQVVGEKAPAPIPAQG